MLLEIEDRVHLNFQHAGRAGFRQGEALGYLTNEALVSNDQTHLYAVAKREILRGGQ